MTGGHMTAAAFLIAELRRARVRRGWSQEELAKAINYSPSLVSAVELGQQPPAPKYLELFDEALETGGLFSRMFAELVSLDKAQAWLRGWHGTLEQARALRWFDPLHVPGLLQTEPYARAVFEADDLLDSEEVERRLRDRMDSQAVLYGERPPRVVAVVDEVALRRRVGSRKVMCEQAEHLGPFILAALGDGVEVACLGGQIGGQELERSDHLLRLQGIWAATLGAALPPQESIDRLRELAESWS